MAATCVKRLPVMHRGVRPHAGNWCAFMHFKCAIMLISFLVLNFCIFIISCSSGYVPLWFFCCEIMADCSRLYMHVSVALFVNRAFISLRLRAVCQVWVTDVRWYVFVCALHELLWHHRRAVSVSVCVSWTVVCLSSVRFQSCVAYLLFASHKTVIVLSLFCVKWWDYASPVAAAAAAATADEK